MENLQGHHYLKNVLQKLLEARFYQLMPGHNMSFYRASPVSSATMTLTSVLTYFSLHPHFGNERFIKYLLYCISLADLGACTLNCFQVNVNSTSLQIAHKIY